MGPEDTVIVQLFGKQNEQYELAVTRDGVLLFPGIGPLSVAGLTFPRLQQEIQARVQHQLSGVQASVTLGRIRSIRVFVLGDAERPGSYAVGGMSTLTNALFASGGVLRLDVECLECELADLGPDNSDAAPEMAHNLSAGTDI